MFYTLLTKAIGHKKKNGTTVTAETAINDLENSVGQLNDSLTDYIITRNAKSDSFTITAKGHKLITVTTPTVEGYHVIGSSLFASDHVIEWMVNKHGAHNKFYIQDISNGVQTGTITIQFQLAKDNL